jgi:hypothetical protein
MKESVKIVTTREMIVTVVCIAVVLTLCLLLNPTAYL